MQKMLEPLGVMSMETWIDPWVWKISWRRKWLPIPVFLPEKFYRQWSLMGCSLWGCKDSKWLSMHTSIHRGSRVLPPVYSQVTNIYWLSCISLGVGLPGPRRAYFIVVPACSVTRLYWPLWDSVDCSLPGSYVHGISQARILEWAVISSARGSSQPRDWTHVSCIGRGIL